MSVAFRREGDEEHLEPKFEIPIPSGPNLVTPRGLALIGERVAEIEAQLAGETDEDRIKAVKRDLRYWQTRQITAEVVPAPTGETVEIGTTVSFRLNGKPRELSIVGDDEADPARGSISFSAPLARALLGAEPGELLPFGDKEEAIEVLSVEALS
ncbi:GreA/GreB family elongation factor [Novosphingobium sp. G106]|uniref:GreA/GreB family elongation factor n=1 Tax=Novosphingobium sp. G106 TaxID=2849500 RepID=UPI001C2CF3CF|nr:GreA/GreB family elongation factor [Novosphingobium sp. G106]MBV1689087.1 GreA/GreB family elongation factor [Novosphingobium sp. G106]